MGILRVQHSFQGVTGQPDDQFVNVFYFQPAVGAGTLAALATTIKQFWSATSPDAIQPLSYYMSGVADNPGASVKMYDLDDAIPRAPVYAETYNPSAFGAGASKNLPDEVALCLSYTAGPASGLPIARRRGRLFIGPFNENALISTGLNAESGPVEGLRVTLAQGAAMMAAAAAGNGYDWSVFSPTNNEAVSILSCWVNNAWDTQRRRGNKPSSRYTVPIAS